MGDKILGDVTYARLKSRDRQHDRGSFFFRVRHAPNAAVKK